MKTIKFMLLCPAICILIIMGCKKDNDSHKGTSTVSVRLTDAPANYDAVYVDIREVRTTGSGASEVLLNTNPGIYNLLDLTNGIDTLIATGTLPSGRLEQIRLVLGENNSVVVNGTTHPLATPSAEQSGLKVQIHNTLLPGIAYMILLDFDAHQSIVESGNGEYILKPVIRTVNATINGSITGIIVPGNINCSVTAEENGVYYSTYSASTGSFLLQAIPPGTYTVTITPAPPVLPVTLFNVTVTAGNLTDLGVINL